MAYTLLALPTLSAGFFPDSYDRPLKESHSRYLYTYTPDWLHLKAQCYQESLLKPDAVSHAGAMGLCQFMPATWREVTAKMGINASPFNPRANALAAGYYMRQLLRGWKAERTDQERLRWAWGAYNCGFGCVLKAQEKSGGETRWYLIEAYLPWETQQYVRKIEHWHGRMRG